jgi:uncharacterized protein (DUF305 family)
MKTFNPMLCLKRSILCILLPLAVMPGPVTAEPPIVQPGAPGEPPRELTAEEAVRIAETEFSPDDVRFMQDMIPHHQQATEMAALVKDRTNNPALVDVARRIDVSQADEIAFMQGWLEERGMAAPGPGTHHSMHATHPMAGMATPEQMAELSAASGADFDRLFLRLMIRHHDGAVKMVEKLLEQPGAAYDPVLYDFTSDIVNDQTVEIERMNALLVGLSTDPRAGLAPGFSDAGEAIWNMALVASLPKPDGFVDPDNPGEAPAQALADENEKADEEQPKPTESSDRRSPMLSFSSTDMAFSGNVLVTGNYHGFNIYQLDEAGVPQLTASVVCPGGQGDVSIIGNLLIMSVQETRSRLDCGLQGVNEDISPDRFRGIRIFDISNLTRPTQVGVVQTCRGSHTHSVVSFDEERIIVYNSGTSSIREREEMETCFDDLPGDPRTALFRIDVIEIPVADPSKSRIIDSPAVFADPETGALAGLWRGGDHGDETQETSETDQCHDITTFPAGGVAAGACSGNGILFDISDPHAPRRIDVVSDPGFAYWHSATFNNDGTKVLFTDEWGGGTRPRCRAWDPLTWGANAIYDIVEGKLEFRSYFKIPAPQLETENCVAHNGSIVPVPGRDLFVQAWYQGGISVIDFTDSANPVEIAYFDRGPIDPEILLTGGFWSAYWYNGHIYATEIVRGLDVLGLLPSEFLTHNEIAAAGLAHHGGTFNPQQQFPVTWPANPVVARAYLDQLNRDGALSPALALDVDAALTSAEASQSKRPRLQELADALETSGGNGIAAHRMAALAEALRGIND